MPENPWSWWLEEEPGIAYAALRPQMGTYPFTDYWRGQESRVYGDYLGQMGRMALAGQAPSLDYTAYLQQYPWMKYWQQLSPSQRGERGGLFAPSLRWSL